MSIFRFSNAGGFGTYQRYNDFLAGNPTTPVYVDNGSMFPIGEFTLAANQSTITFENIPQTYTHLQLRGIMRSNVSSTGGDSGLVRFNNDSTANYVMHRLGGDGSAAASEGFTGQTSVPISVQVRSGNTSNSFGAFVIDLLDYTNTNKFSTVRSLDGWDVNGSGVMYLQSGLWRSTNAVTRIDIVGGNSGSFVAGSSFALYGVL